MVSAENANFRLSSVLNAMPERSVDVAAQRADPALLRDHDGDRLALDQRLLDRRLVVLRRLGEVGAALAERRLRPERLAHLLDLRRRSSSTAPSRSRAGSVSSFFSVRSVLVLGADLHFLELAQVAQPHVEDGVGLHVGELEGLHQDGLRLVLGADDLDDLVEVQIGDQIAAEHFEPVLDLLRGGWFERRSSTSRRWSSHSRSASARPTTFGMRPFTSTFMLSGMRLSSSVSLNSDLHQQLGIDRARARLDHEADVLGGFVAHVGDQRQLLLVEQLGDAARPAAPSAPARGFR